MGIQWTCRSIAASFVGGHARGSALTPSASIRPIAQSARERSGLSSRSGHRPLTPTPRSLICRPSEIARTNARCGGEHVRARRHVGARGGYSVPGRGRDLTGRPARPPTPVHPGHVAPIGSPSRARRAGRRSGSLASESVAAGAEVGARQLRPVPRPMWRRRKTREDAVLAELGYAAGAFGFWARTRRSTWPTRRSSRAACSAGRKVFVRYEAIGVVGVIGPWNYPFTNGVGDAILRWQRAMR